MWLQGARVRELAVEYKVERPGAVSMRIIDEVESGESPGMASDSEAGRSRLEPLSWLRGLARCLEKTTCEYRGRPVPLEAGLETLVRLWSRQHADGAGVYWIGNGGSAATASHLSQDLLNKCGIRSLTFNDPALITCMANDYGYREVFRRPLATLAQEGDVLVAVSSSGMSDNIVGAVEAALGKGLEVVTLSAFSAGNRLRGLEATLSFHTPTASYGQAELAHGALLHAAMDCLEPGPSEGSTAGRTANPA